jgi:preprotein translocase subunit YajC
MPSKKITFTIVIEASIKSFVVSCFILIILYLKILFMLAEERKNKKQRKNAPQSLSFFKGT